MSAGGLAQSGPFRGLVPYDESASGMFFGRTAEAENLFRLVIAEGAQVTAVTGTSGVGKTSLLRAGLLPRLFRQRTQAIYLGGDVPADQELFAAATRAGAPPPEPGETPVDYLVRVARFAAGGTVLVLDHLERVLESGSPPPELLDLLSRSAAAAGPRLRFVFSIELSQFFRLDVLGRTTGLSPRPGAWYQLPALDREQVGQIVEQTALQTGTFFEAGLAATMAADLCREGGCLPFDFQLVMRAVMEQRLTTVRRYQRSGGVTSLIPDLLDRVFADLGRGPARRVLQACARAGDAAAEELAQRLGEPRAVVDQALAGLVSRGLLRKRTVDRGERFQLIHPALDRAVESACAMESAVSEQARRQVRRLALGGGRFSLGDLIRTRKYLGNDLSADESSAYRRGVRRSFLKISAMVLAVGGVASAIALDTRRSYTLALEPREVPLAARVVVDRGRTAVPLLGAIGQRLLGGGVFADTGFSAAGLGKDVVERIRAGRISGTLETTNVAVPSWLRGVLDGLRPVHRGMALVLLGEPPGVTSLRQAFADPASRREALEALAIIGTGRAGEDEILSAALVDGSLELRRRAVEVAAAIDRRMEKGFHSTTLRNALRDPVIEIRLAVLRECARLGPAEAAEILAVALRDKDPVGRREAERAVVELALRKPDAAAHAVRSVLRDADGLIRRTGLALLEQVATVAPVEVAAIFAKLLEDAGTPEDVRVAVLGHLRRAGKLDPALKPLLEQAARAPESSPRLRAAALPLYARLIDPAEAQAMAMVDAKGSPAQRAAAAAVWSAVAAQNPDAATKALKGALYDPAPEVRIEAARSLGALRREGPALVQRTLLDPNVDVMKAALDSAVDLAPAQPYLVTEALGRALKLVRPGSRRFVVEALGRIARERPAAVVPPLARALKEGDGASRVAAATALCTVAAKTPDAATPYLRVAARDPDRDVRAAAAACLGNLRGVDPRAAARLASELAASEEPTVRVAAARALGQMEPEALESGGAALLRLMADSDRAVRVAAVTSLLGVAEKGGKAGPLTKKADDLEKALSGLLIQGDTVERRLAVDTAAAFGVLSLVRQAASDADETVRLAVMGHAAAAGAGGQTILESGVSDRAVAVRAAAVRYLATRKGEGARQVIPVFAAMLRSSDLPTRRSGIAALGELSDAAADSGAILSELLRNRSEILRADATAALGRLAALSDGANTAVLEATLADPAHDVRSAAIRGLAAAWARKKSPEVLGHELRGAETDSARRLVAVEALVAQAQAKAVAPVKGDAAVGAEQARAAAAAAVLGQVAKDGPPLARLFAQVGRAFLEAHGEDVHAFLDKLLGG